MNVAIMLVKNNTLKMCYEKVKTNETRYSRDTLNKQGREEMRMQPVVLCVAIWEPYKQGSISAGGFQWRLILSKQSAYADTEGLGSVNHVVKNGWKKKKKRGLIWRSLRKCKDSFRLCCFVVQAHEDCTKCKVTWKQQSHRAQHGRKMIESTSF